jgi:hypothetical protein
MKSQLSEELRQSDANDQHQGILTAHTTWGQRTRHWQSFEAAAPAAPPRPADHLHHLPGPPSRLTTARTISINGFINSYLSELQSIPSFLAPKPKQPQAVATRAVPRWIPPPSAIAKFNVDTAVSRSKDQGVSTAFCRDSNGVYLGASAIVFPGITDPATLESLACWWKRISRLMWFWCLITVHYLLILCSDLCKCLFTGTRYWNTLLYCIAFILLLLKGVRIMVELIKVLEESCQFSKGQTGFSRPGGWL